LVTYRPSDGTWQIANYAPGIQEARALLGEELYEENKKALQEFLCNYFSAGACNAAQGSSISPLGATRAGGKILKVRWALPGCGKSGSLRLCVVAYCAELRVFVAAGFMRRENPTDQDFKDATALLP
jgi:hypothetical protein